MNPLMFLNGAKIFVIVAVLGYGMSVLKGCEANRVAERDAAIVANAEKVTAQANASALAIANAQLDAINRETLRSLEIATKAQQELATRFSEIQKGQAEQKAVLEGDRLQKAVRGKRELVEKMANRATMERFNEVESLFNE
jgi:hypothetical protein